MGALVEELLGAGHEVQWFVAPIDAGHSEVARLAKQGARVEPLPPPPKGYVRLARARWRLDRAMGAASSVAERVQSFWPDHVFVNQGGTWDGTLDWVFPTLQAMPGRYSLICHSNFPGPALSEADLERARALAGGAHRMFFNSAWVHDLAEAQIARSIPCASYFQLPLRWRPESPLVWPENLTPRLVTVSRLDAYVKGLDLVIDAVGVLKMSGQAVELLMVGDGSDAAYLRDYARFRGVEDRIVFTGRKEDLEEVWRECELLLLPSRFEGLAVSMLEAMSFGRPVLRTPHGGCKEWIEDGVNGFVCPAAEVDLLVAALKRALAERGRWREMGLAAHTKVKRDLDPRPARVFLEALRLEGGD